MFKYLKLQYTKLKKRREYKKFLIDKCSYYHKFKVNDNLSVDLFSDLWTNTNLPFKLNNVKGLVINFVYDLNTSNLPNYVDGDLIIRHCKLKTFKNFPIHITGNLDVSDNFLELFDGFPNFVGGNLYADTNNFKILDRELNVIGRIDLNFNPIFLYKSNHPNTSLHFTKILNFCHTLRSFGISEKLVSNYELLDRINEFEIISDNYSVDILRLEDLFHFYSINGDDINFRYITTLGYSIT